MKSKTKKLLISLALTTFITAFNLQDNPSGGWYQQFFPNLNNAPVSDINFTDSLNGWAVAYGGNLDDTGYVLQTVNGGNYWIKNIQAIEDFTKVNFLSINIGYVSGYDLLYKTTNRGVNWSTVNLPGMFFYVRDISILSEDTIYVTDNESLTGGLYRTTNGGVNWQQLYYDFGGNPEKIYMYDGNLGFMGAAGLLYRTTTGGINWTLVPGASDFTDMKFIDSLTGWKCDGNFYKTINGGINWINIQLPQKSGIILTSRIYQFSVLNNDTIWGVGSEAFLGPNQFRGLLYITSNGGNSWGYQLPDTSIHSLLYRHIQFINKDKGWAYWLNGGVRTISGGDSTILVNVKQLSIEIPDDFILYQNYPNPFNPNTTISYELQITSNVRLCIYNIQGKGLRSIVYQKQNAGNYKVKFDAKELPSGIYFYTLEVSNDKGKINSDTKKMILIK